MSKYILAVDQGTTGSKVLLFDGTSQVVASRYRELTQHYPQPGWVEQDPLEMWQQVQTLLADIANSVRTEDIAALALTNQRETVLAWDRDTGEPLGPAVVWQCRRSVPICQRLLAAGHGSLFRTRTGLLIDPYFSGTKIRWLIENEAEVQRRLPHGRVCFGTVDTWLLYRLTQGRVFATDYSNASRTLLYDIYRCDWDADLLGLLEIPNTSLPAVLPSSHRFGGTQGVSGVPDGIPICSMIGDSQASLFGLGCLEPGLAKATFGTGTSVMIYVGEEAPSPPEGLAATLAWGVDGRVGYALEGIINATGTTMQWLRDGLRILDNVKDSGAIAAALPDNGGVYIVPAFAGLGAPYWTMDAAGLICGLTRGTSREQLIRAGLESMAYQVKDVIELAAATGCAPRELRIDGGASDNEFLLQFQADMLDVDLTRAPFGEVSALGAAHLAGLQVGLWEDLDAVKRQWHSQHVYRPKMKFDERNRLYEDWQLAVRRALVR